MLDHDDGDDFRRDRSLLDLGNALRPMEAPQPSRLMQAMADALLKDGFSSIGLWVLEKNIGARWFYEGLGGTIAARMWAKRALSSWGDASVVTRTTRSSAAYRS